jgi:hypothetical protein
MYFATARLRKGFKEFFKSFAGESVPGCANLSRRGVESLNKRSTGLLLLLSEICSIFVISKNKFNLVIFEPITQTRFFFITTWPPHKPDGLCTTHKSKLLFNEKTKVRPIMHHNRLNTTSY